MEDFRLPFILYSPPPPSSCPFELSFHYQFAISFKNPTLPWNWFISCTLTLTGQGAKRSKDNWVREWLQGRSIAVQLRYNIIIRGILSWSGSPCVYVRGVHLLSLSSQSLQSCWFTCHIPVHQFGTRITNFVFIMLLLRGSYSYSESQKPLHYISWKIFAVTLSLLLIFCNRGVWPIIIFMHNHFNTTIMLYSRTVFVSYIYLCL